MPSNTPSAMSRIEMSKGAPAQIVDRDLATALLLEPIGQRGGGRLVNNAQHFEPGDPPGVFGGLALRVVEISRDGDDGLRHLFTEVGLGGLPHPGQNEGADLARAVALAADLDPGIAIVAADDSVRNQALVLLDHRVVVAAADQPLDREDRVLRVGDRLAARRLPDQYLAGARETNHRRRRARPFGVLDHLGLAAFHHGNTRISRPQIDPNDFGHSTPLPLAGQSRPWWSGSPFLP
jgi:NAD-specific glutamate dehydrogenase